MYKECSKCWWFDHLNWLVQLHSQSFNLSLVVLLCFNKKIPESWCWRFRIHHINSGIKVRLSLLLCRKWHFVNICMVITWLYTVLVFYFDWAELLTRSFTIQAPRWPVRFVFNIFIGKRCFPHSQPQTSAHAKFEVSTNSRTTSWPITKDFRHFISHWVRTVGN